MSKDEMKPARIDRRLSAAHERIEELGRKVASRDAEVDDLGDSLAQVKLKNSMLIEERDQLRDESAELVAALKPFGAIDLVESRLPAEFAMLVLRARAAIAKVRKP